MLWGCQPPSFARPPPWVCQPEVPTTYVGVARGDAQGELLAAADDEGRVRLLSRLLLQARLEGMVVRPLYGRTNGGDRLLLGWRRPRSEEQRLSAWMGAPRGASTRREPDDAMRLERREVASAGARRSHGVAVPMRDGVRLMANIFRPELDGRYPVVMSVSPYGKHVLPEDYGLFRALGINVGTFRISDYAAFEAHDPGFWRNWVPRAGP